MNNIKTIGDLQASIADNFFRENGQKNSKMLVTGRRTRRTPRTSVGGAKKR